MRDKSFLEAMFDLQERVYGHINESTQRMILHRITASNATLDIENTRMRAVVTNELITGQITALLALLRDSGLLAQAQYDEFTAYLQRALLAQHSNAANEH